MRRCSGVLLLGLMSCATAGAQGVVTHGLTVSIHPAVHPQVSQTEIEDILKGASDILQGNTNIASQNNCKVGFQFKGLIPFPASLPADITNATELEQVHEVPADVKVVQNITYCAQGQDNGGYAGCAWRPQGRQRTAIVARSQFSSWIGNGSVLWAHEYGHTTGLIHRYEGDAGNLMTPCVLQVFSVLVSQSECAHFRAGPVSKYPPTLGPACPGSPIAGARPD
jgi:hypothetical protein